MVADVRISIIMPTVGANTLQRALGALEGAGLAGDDELILVGDGDPHGVEDMLAAASINATCRYAPLVPQGGCVGQPARNYGMGLATGTHLVFTQDDQMMMPNAIAGIRRVVAEVPDAPHIFRVIPHCRAVVPIENFAAEGAIDGDCIVPPNDDKLGQWGMRYNGDWDFIRETLVNHDSVVFHAELISCEESMYNRVLTWKDVRRF